VLLYLWACQYIGNDLCCSYKNVFALSDTIWTGTPLLEVKHLKDLRNVWAVTFGTSSKCTAHVIKQVYKHLTDIRSLWLFDLEWASKIDATIGKRRSFLDTILR